MSTKTPRPREDQVRRMLADGLSQKAIARKLHIGRSTVFRIIHGNPPGPSAMGLDNRRMTKAIHVCERCGVLVHLSGGRQPCVACQTRAANAPRLPERPGLRGERLEFDLEPDEELRRISILANARATR